MLATKKKLAPCLEAALNYLSRGWAPIPVCPADHQGVTGQHEKDCNRPGKTPLCSWSAYQTRLPREAELRLYWTRCPTANVGIVLGRVSGMIGLDIDGPEAEALLRELLPQDLPPALEFKTPGGGRRLLYPIPPDLIIPRRRFDRGASHVIILGEGSYTVMPPSVHATGGVYQ